VYLPPTIAFITTTFQVFAPAIALFAARVELGTARFELVALAIALKTDDDISSLEQ
jgi:hypothetical protein